jgi:hypothetical protein
VRAIRSASCEAFRLLFRDGPGLVGLLDYLDDESAEWRNLVLAVMKEFTSDNPRKPVSMWDDVDESFGDVVAKMTSLDLKKEDHCHGGSRPLVVSKCLIHENVIPRDE